MSVLEFQLCLFVVTTTIGWIDRTAAARWLRLALSMVIPRVRVDLWIIEIFGHEALPFGAKVWQGPWAVLRIFFRCSRRR